MIKEAFLDATGIWLIVLFFVALYAWYRNWRRNAPFRKQRRFHAGYDWAAGMLLRGEDPTVQAENPFDFDEFDKGALQAVQDWRLCIVRIL